MDSTSVSALNNKCDSINKQMKKIVVTGGLGFIGSHTVV